MSDELTQIARKAAAKWHRFCFNSPTKPPERLVKIILAAVRAAVKERGEDTKLLRIYAQAMDDIYNHSDEARRAVLEHFGWTHHPETVISEAIERSACQPPAPTAESGQ